MARRTPEEKSWRERVGIGLTAKPPLMPADHDDYRLWLRLLNDLEGLHGSFNVLHHVSKSNQIALMTQWLNNCVKCYEAAVEVGLDLSIFIPRTKQKAFSLAKPREQ